MLGISETLVLQSEKITNGDNRSKSLNTIGIIHHNLT